MLVSENGCTEKSAESVLSVCFGCRQTFPDQQAVSLCMDKADQSKVRHTKILMQKNAERSGILTRSTAQAGTAAVLRPASVQVQTRLAAPSPCDVAALQKCLQENKARLGAHLRAIACLTA